MDVRVEGEGEQNGHALWDSSLRTAGPRVRVSTLREAEISALHKSRPINDLALEKQLRYGFCGRPKTAEQTEGVLELCSAQHHTPVLMSMCEAFSSGGVLAEEGRPPTVLPQSRANLRLPRRHREGAGGSPRELRLCAQPFGPTVTSRLRLSLRWGKGEGQWIESPEGGLDGNLQATGGKGGSGYNGSAVWAAAQ
ncbi:hypothetical protein P4O66_011917 [Electrophorus voltai]|uniref:Uncharacterized protein n=1 Tax=Electrophorus voltai TaxID=2609070 RepID=A0AAD9DUE4_9TELE|nr:hypothetical protein P4O66_011917 [Electrophorus voltai]